ncbi:VOC family protein [Vibrio sp. T187]|uniref:VOC family protein n=1 Tax=Vibrio TaxID=662 RepID=UPI0010CA1E60|nr:MULTISPECIES: VOC family protein [Vibrio]MBW3695940.1 VOC family protein [Vibrio sp. T187]
MAEKPKPFNGLRHLALVVHEFEECLQFYTEVMGMSVLRRASDNLVYLTCGNDNLSLGRARSSIDVPAQTLDHFGFVVDSKEELQQWFEYMQSINVPLLDTPHDHSDGARSFHCQDPAGNVVQPLFHPAISGQVIR